MTKLSVIIVSLPEIMKYIAFYMYRVTSKIHALGSATELTSLHAFVLRLFSTVALEMEPKFWNLTGESQIFSGKEELWDTELYLTTLASDKDSEENISRTDRGEW